DEEDQNIDDEGQKHLAAAQVDFLRGRSSLELLAQNKPQDEARHDTQHHHDYYADADPLPIQFPCHRELLSNTRKARGDRYWRCWILHRISEVVTPISEYLRLIACHQHNLMLSLSKHGPQAWCEPLPSTGSE